MNETYETVDKIRIILRNYRADAVFHDAAVRDIETLIAQAAEEAEDKLVKARDTFNENYLKLSDNIEKMVDDARAEALGLAVKAIEVLPVASMEPELEKDMCIAAVQGVRSKQ